MNIEDLKPNPKNPRKVSAEKLKQLEKALFTFGDISGIVFNQNTGQLIGGHQRIQLFKKWKGKGDVDIQIVSRYKKPTMTGTMAEGYISLGGERFSYREVYWDIGKEKAANIAANKNAGDWDDELLQGWFDDLADLNYDLDLTMFDADERVSFFSDDEPKPKKGKKKKAEHDGRVSSSEVKQFQLTFTTDYANEFIRLVEFFQVGMNSDSVSDTVLEVLRRAKEANL